MGSQQTGLNPDKVNDALKTAKNQGDKVMDAVHNGFDAMLKSLKDNWGTQDGKVWVEGECLTAIKKMEDEIADTLTKIGDVINKVALAQLSDTKNSQKVNGNQAIKKVNTKITMKDKLDNGYVGVYEELKGDLTTKEGELITNVDQAIAGLQTAVIGKTDIAFNLVGAADKVSAQCTTYIQRVQNIVKTGLTSLNNDISTQVGKADTYVRDIQNAGLRGALGGN